MLQELIKGNLISNEDLVLLEGSKLNNLQKILMTNFDETVNDHYPALRDLEILIVKFRLKLKKVGKPLDHSDMT